MYNVPAPILKAHALEHAAMRRGGLGTVPSSFGKASQDVLLRASSAWATRMMRWAQRYPQDQRPAKLEGALNRISPGLGSKVRRIGERLISRGEAPNQALHRALQFGFADQFVDSVLELGRDAMTGRKPSARNMIVGNLGDSGDGLGQTDGTDRTPEQITGDIVSGVVCSDGVASLVGHAAGVNDTKHSAEDRQLAAGLTEIGFIIGRSVSGAVGHPCTPTAPTAPVAPPAPVQPATPPWVIPAAAGAALLVGAVVLVVALK
jgi:hypothetical protein